MGVSLERLKTLIDYDLLLSSLGFNAYYSNQDEIRAPCAIHGGDNKTAFCFKKSVGRFYCFTKKCEVDSAGVLNNDVIGLVMKVNRCSFIEAVSYLEGLFGVVVDFSADDRDDKISYNIKSKEKFIKGINNIKKKSKLPEIDHQMVYDSIIRGAKYFSSIGFESNIIETFELGSMVDESGVERGTIPIRDDVGRLVGLSGRRVFGDEEPRYKIIRDFKKSKVLYNLYNAKKVKDRYNGKVIVVEGFKALWYVYSCGFENVCAVMGAKISQDQANLLIKYDFSDCVLMLDGDDAGKVGMDRSIEILRNKIKITPIYLPNEKSPDDIEKEDLKDLLLTVVFS